ncbi:MAG: ATP/GTP-binding protein, partial [Acidobacteriota bacterium]
MVELNHGERLVRAKILYYGPAAGGKTTNLQVLHQRAHKERRLDLISVNTAQDRTMLFDLLPLTTPAFRSYELRFQVIAVPGQRLYATTRKMLLKNADSLVFVANSATDRWQDNLQSLKEMTENLLEHGIDPSTVPTVFQYNKRDLPDVTALEIMERLNARGSDSFPSVATQGKGVLETFAAVLKQTMAALSTRYRIGANMSDPQSAEEWAEKTMKEIFGGIPSDSDMKEAEPATPPASHTVVRVRAPSASRVFAPPEPAPPAPPLAPPVPELPSLTQTASSHSPPPPPSAAAAIESPEAALAMVESYAEAASALADHIGKLSEDRESERRRGEHLSLIAEGARDLLEGSASDAPSHLKKLIQRLGHGLRTAQASLALQAPDGRLVQVLGTEPLADDPLKGAVTPGGRPLGPALLEAGKTMVQGRFEPGVLDSLMSRLGPDCAAVVAVPLKTPTRPVGLLTFYLPREAPFPDEAEIEHLEQAGLALTLTLLAVADASGAARLQACLTRAFAGEAAEGAIRSTARMVECMEGSLARMRSHEDSPSGLDPELARIDDFISNLKAMTETATALRTAQLPAPTATPPAHLLEQLSTELKEPLSGEGIQFQVDCKPGAPAVLAEPVLLKAVLRSLVEGSRRALAGALSGGLIRLLV